MISIKIRPHVYLDTSVFSALDDERWPERRKLTAEFWQIRNDNEVCTSEVARREMAATQDDEKRQRLLAYLEEVRVEALTSEMRELAEHYISLNVFTRRQEGDALHVAAATLLRQDVLLSWNFAHLVNRRRRAVVIEVNRALGLHTPEILAPPEL